MDSLPFVPYQIFWHLSISSIFILSVISSIIYYQSKGKSFKYYALYGFFLFLYLFFKAPYDFPFRDAVVASRYAGVNWYIQVIYNCSYFIFFLYFLNIKTHFSVFYKWIKRLISAMFIISSVAFVISILLSSPEYFSTYFVYFFAPFTTLLAIYTILKALSLPGNLKFFVAIGGGVYIAFALFALYVSFNGNQVLGFHSMFYFYIGVFIEHLVFATGLAYKVKIINRNLILQYEENEKIKKEQSSILQQKLRKREDEIFKLTEAAENDRIKNLETKYKNKVNHLHLNSLRNQMNPHFIFNALNSIKVFLIDNNKTQAIYYLNKFSKLIRIILESSRVNDVSLNQEIETIELYFGIEKMRFDDDVELIINIDDNINLQSLKVPPLILQPFIENSLWHGLMLSTKKKKIEIDVYFENGIAKLAIRDNGVGRKLAAAHRKRKTYKKESIGLKITKERIKYFNDKGNYNYAYNIIDLYDENNEPAGTEVQFTFK